MGTVKVSMRTIATLLSLILLSVFLILFGVTAIALTAIWPPLGAGAVAAGVGARLLHEARERP